MAYYAGDSGRLWLNLAENVDHGFMATGADLVKATQVQNWSFTWTQDMLPIDRLRSTDRSFYPGMKSLTGNCKIFYYRDDSARGDGSNYTASWIFNKIFKVGTSVDDVATNDSPEFEFKLGFKYAANVNRFIRFQAYITQFSQGASTGEVVSADISFQMNGAPIENTL